MSTKAAENNNLVPAQPKTKDEGTPENNAKIHVHDATEKTEDIKPKQVGPENAKEILTGALAQKVSEFNTRFKKKSEFNLGKAVEPAFFKDPRLPGELKNEKSMAERSETALRRSHWGPDLSPMFNNFMPHVARAAGTALGGQTGGNMASTASRVFLANKNMEQQAYNRDELARRTEIDVAPQRYNEAINAIKTRPNPAPTLPAGQPRPPVVQPPRGIGSSLLNKKAALTDYGSIGGGAMVGGLGGAALGGLAGLISPGQDMEYDNYGRPVGSKQRSRLGAALRGALGGGAIGGLGGAAAGHFMGPQTNQALAALQPYLNSAQEYGKGMYKKMFPQKTDSAPAPFPNAAAATGAPKAIPAASSAGADTYVGEGGGTSAPMLPPNAAVTGPAKKPGEFDNFFRNLANGATAGAW